VKETKKSKGIINFADFMDNMNSEEVQISASPRHDNIGGGSA